MNSGKFIKRSTILVCQIVIWLALPVVSLYGQIPVLGPTPVCNGDTQQYSSGGYGSVTWSVTGGGTIIGPSVGVFVNIQWTSNGTVHANACYWVDPPQECYTGQVPCDPDVQPPCYGQICDDPPPYQVCDSGQLAVTVNSLPSLPTISASTTPAVPGASILSAANGTVFQWLRGGVVIPGATGVKYLTTMPGSYTVRSQANGCFSTSTSISVTGNNRNFVVDNSLLIPGIVTEDQFFAQALNNNGNDGYIAQSVAYLDGHGKEIQTLQRQAAAGRTDIIKPVEYDELGRVKYSYLPIVNTQNSGLFIDNLTTLNGNYTGSPHYNYYNVPSALNINVAKDTHPFAQSKFEPSPLGRVIEQGSIGSAWQLGGKTAEKVYSTNPASLVRKWVVNATTGLPETSLQWATGALVMNRSRQKQPLASVAFDPESEEYTDLAGLKLLVRTKESTTWLETYYVYDPKGNLRYMLPPQLLDELGTGGTLAPTTDQLNRWAWQYQYDTYNRVVASKGPGTDWEYTVYDMRDRVVLTQDGKQRLINQWTFVKYDEWDRPVVTGLYNPGTALTRTDLQNTVNGLNAGKGYQNATAPQESPYDARTGVDIVSAQYDNYREYVASNSITLSPGFNFAASTNTTFRASIGTPNTDIVFPTSNFENLTVTYYDSYLGNEALFQNPEFQFVTETWNTSTNDNWQRSNNIPGEVTGVSVKILGSNKWIHAVTYYDKRKRPIQTLKSNQLAGVIRTSTLYDFAGKVLEGQTHYGGSYDVAWQSLVNVSASGSTLTKTAGGSAWNAGASSVQVLQANTSGYVETTLSSTTHVAMLGLSDTDPDAGNASIDFGFRMNGNVMEVHENGVVKFTGASGSLVVGDVLRIHRLGSTIYYLKNGKIVYTSAVVSTSALLVDVSIFSPTGVLSAVKASFAGQGASFVNGTKITRRHQYDHAGRLLRTFHRINQQPEVLLAASEFNQLGDVVDNKLHSADGGTTFLQSLDYRYHIKGWTTSINGVSTPDAGETDYYAMEFGYENALESGNTNTRFDGLISAIKWKTDIDTREKLYNYNYNNLKQLTASAYKARSTSASPWTLHPDRYTEAGITYDKNGNILSLSRYQGNGTAKIDELTYDYGSPRSNLLLKVGDSAPAAERDKGFKDGTNPDNDYAYDANGNLLSDKNKGITAITYYFNNLPQQVNFSNGTYMTFTYDASGTKLQQALYNAANQVQAKTDYVGELVFMNDQLLLVKHEQGRALPADNQNLISNPTTREANSTEGFTALGSCTLASEFVSGSGQTYVKATSSAAGSYGMQTIGGSSVAVKAGQKYTYKILGYQSTGTAAQLVAVGNPGNVQISTGPSLPAGAANENWVTASFTIPANITSLDLRLVVSSGASGNVFYVNRVALYKDDFDYQYYLTDQVGSPRVVLSTTPATLTFAATMEAENYSTENTQWLNLNPTYRETNVVANATPGGNEVLRMNNQHRVGPSKSFKVLPGDVINATVQAYYPSASGLTQATTTVMTSAVQAVLSGGSPVVDGAISSVYGNSTTYPLFAPFQGSTRPSAFINYILFDEFYQVLEAKSVPVGATANVKHAVNLPTVNVKLPGYLFVYLSYDNESTAPVYFDEFKITYTESPVVQINNNYPYGMTAMSWLREGENENKYLYQGKEFVNETGWHDFHARQYDATLGRWFAIDPQDQFSSPFLSMGNNPVLMVDPDGEFAFIPLLLTAMKVVGALQTAYSVYQGYQQNGVLGAGQALASAATGMVLGSILGGMTGGALVDMANIKGAFGGSVIGGLSGALSGGLAGGLNSVLWGGNFGDGFRGGAIGGGLTGSVSGGNWGFINAKNAGKNVWWGSSVKWGNTQYSFFNSEKPYIDVNISKRLKAIKTEGPQCVFGCQSSGLDYYNEQISYQKLEAEWKLRHPGKDYPGRGDVMQAYTEAGFNVSAVPENSLAFAANEMASYSGSPTQGGKLVGAVYLPSSGSLEAIPGKIQMHNAIVSRIRFYHSGKTVINFMDPGRIKNSMSKSDFFKHSLYLFLFWK